MMVALLFIGIGTLLTLAGLAAVGPQVRVHQVRANSRPAWLLKFGAGLLILGEVVALITGLDPALVTICLIMGGAVLFGGLAIASHERQQQDFLWASSLSLQLFGLGVVMVLLTFGLR